MSDNKRYVVKRTEEYTDELQHWGNKGSYKEDHKYISKKMVNGKWVYTYPEDKKSGSSSQFNTSGFKQPQFNAKGNSPFKTTATKAIKTATEKAAKRRKKVSKAVNSTIKSAKKQIDKGKKWLDNLFD